MKQSETLTNLQKYLKTNKLKGLAVTDITTINYLTGFTFVGEGDAFLLVNTKKAICFTKPLYLIDITKKCPFLTFVNSLNIQDLIKKVKNTKGYVFDPRKSNYINGTALKKAGFQEYDNICTSLREVKTESEIKKIKYACEISAKAFDLFKKNLKVGMTEKQSAKLLEDFMAKLGGEGLAFDTIMAFGENSANPHHNNSNRKLKQNEVVLVDFGCKYQGYCSDITRTFWFGKKPSKDFEFYFNAVKNAYTKAKKALKAGISAYDVDKVARDYFETDYKASKYFIHTLGHNLGLDIHERPYLSTKDNSILKEGALTTIEPGLYFEGKFGIRYENTFLITKKGNINLTDKKEK